jgi:4-amino-4-deoxy-L-arabinose transferase-like glycosyltransferase
MQLEPRARISAAEKWLVVAVLVAVLGEHLFLIGYKTYANVDEAYASALASRLLDGQTLYVGAVSQRGPLMYFSFAALAWLFGWSNVVALRLVTFLVCESVVLLTYWATRTTLSTRAAPLALCVMGYAFSYGFPLSDGAALNGELLQAPLLIVSFVLGCQAMRHPGARRLRLLVWTGVSFGLAACIKQSALLHVVPIVVWLVAAHRRGGWAKVLVPGAAVIGSALLVPLAYVVYAAATGSLREAFYYTFTYNTTVHLRPIPLASEHPWVGPFLHAVSDNRLFCAALLLMLVAVLARVLHRARAGGWRRRFGTHEYLALHTVIGVLSASVLVRFFPHYFVAALPFVAMALGVTVVKLLPATLPPRTWRIVGAAAALFLIVSGAITANFVEVADGRTMETPSTKVVARYVEAITTPEDRIFVWGFSPELYGYSRRKPAGRYVFSTYVTGFVPWYWDALEYEAGRVVPGSVDALLDDLARERPKVVIDAGSVMFGRSMRAYPRFDAWMHDSLCFLLRISAYDVYLRREPGQTCVVTSFPRLHAPQDFIGGELQIAMPRPVDEATSETLPRGFDRRPIWFPEEPPPPHLEAAVDERFEKNRASDLKKGSAVLVSGEDPAVP